jgi:hypothetical protein
MTNEILLGVLSSIAIGMFSWIAVNLVTLKARIAALDARVNGMPQTLNDVESRLTRVEVEIAKVDAHLSDLPCRGQMRCGPEHME